MNRWPDPPTLSASFYKAHGLGNDYLVFEEGEDWKATPEAVRSICDPHRGVGSDGIVALLADRSGGLFRLRMFNPDGSEFERSGNGLRVLASYLARTGVPSPYLIAVGGGRVRMVVHRSEGPAHDVSVEMGHARVGPDAVGLAATALDATGRLAGPGDERLHVVPVSVGNPHLVVLGEPLTEQRLDELGRFLVRHPALAHGANVQLAAPAGRGACDALIWERGVGPTTASGTSACAVATALVSEGAVPPGEVIVRMPGGRMVVTVSEELDVVLRGPVAAVCTGALTSAFLTTIAR
ncbi:MAG TPA: diaminopimelate epimerase [Longimicrobiales bacterium]|nr:diaminopimelate epimerase [Longimicrobiales bacterium]